MGWSKSYTIGRAPDSDAFLPHDRVSRRHAKLMLDREGGIYLADLESKHGTFVHRGGTWRRIENDFVGAEEPLRFGTYQTTPVQLLEHIERHAPDKSTSGESRDQSDAHKQATVLVADVVAYSRMMSQDPDSTLSALKAARRDVIDPMILHYSGRIFGEAGDAVCAEFRAAADALRAASAIQSALANQSFGRAGKRLSFRIGIHAGEVIAERDNLFGSAVNIAARLQALSAPGHICISALVKSQAEPEVKLAYVDLGEKTLKNIPYPIQVFEVVPSLE